MDDLPEFYTEGSMATRLGLSHVSVLRKWLLSHLNIRPVAALVTSSDQRRPLYSAEQVAELENSDDE